MKCGFQRGGRPAPAWWLGVWLVLCACLVSSGTAQLSHVHGKIELRQPTRGVLAPLSSDCTWCEAAQVTMPVVAQPVSVLLPTAEVLATGATRQAEKHWWSFEGLSRPPPVGVLRVVLWDGVRRETVPAEELPLS